MNIESAIIIVEAMIFTGRVPRQFVESEAKLAAPGMADWHVRQLWPDLDHEFSLHAARHRRREWATATNARTADVCQKGRRRGVRKVQLRKPVPTICRGVDLWVEQVVNFAFRVAIRDQPPLGDGRGVCVN